MRRKIGGLMFRLSMIAALCSSSGCGSSSASFVGSSSLEPVAASRTSSPPILHEAELAQDPTLRARLVGQLTAIHLEATRAGLWDTGTVGEDVLPFTSASSEVMTFHLESADVERALLIDRDGRRIANLARGQTEVQVPAGDFWVILQSSGSKDALLGIGQIKADTSSSLISGQLLTRTTPGVYITELSAFPSAITGAATATTAFVGAFPNAAPDVVLVESLADFTQHYGSAVNPLSQGVSQFFANGGQQAYVINEADSTLASLEDGLALAPSVDFNLLVLPDLPALSESDADTLITQGQIVCQQKKAMLLLDLPATIETPEQAADWAQARPQFASPYLAAYWPGLSLSGSNSSTDTVGAAPTMAGIFAASDTAFGVWNHPAGLSLPLSGVSAIQPALTQEQIGTLEPLGINSMIADQVKPGSFVCWGDRTLGSPSIRYIAEQRLLNYVENSLLAGLQWVVFEPAGPSLYSSLTSQVSGFLTTLWSEGGLQGATTAEAFQVQCDTANNPPESVESGVVNYEINLAIVLPAVFVVLNGQSQVAAPDSGG